MGSMSVSHINTCLVPFFHASDEAPPERLSPLLSPVRLRAAAHLYGVETIALRHACVLEIDCGTGNNLLPFALAYPEATVIGVSLDAAECLAGQELAQNLGASNLHLFALSLDQVDANIGKFDYIIIRRLFGRLPSDAANALLQTCESLLTPKGIACVGYETYPGAKIAEVVRDAMLMHAHAESDPVQFAAQAKAALTLFGEGIAKSNPQARGLEATAWQMAARLRHEGAPAVLGNAATPCYFIEFAGRLAQAGMSYVGDCDAMRDLPELWGNNVQLVNTLLSMGQTGAMRLQYLDLVTGRSSRHSLLMSAGRESARTYQPDIVRLLDLRWAGGWQRHSWGPPDRAGSAVFVNHQGRKWVSPDAVSTAVLDVLALAWPTSLSFATLVSAVKRACARRWQLSTDPEESICSALLRMMQDEVVHYCLDEGPYDVLAPNEFSLLPTVAHISTRPTEVANPAEPVLSGATWLPFNLWHEHLANGLSGVEWQRLAQMRQTADLACAIKQNAVGQAFLSLDGAGLVMKAAAVQQADMVRKLWSMGGLLADTETWRDFFLPILQQSDGRSPFWDLYLAAVERHELAQYAKESAPMHGSSMSLTPQQDAQLQSAWRTLAELNYSEAEAHALQLLKRLPKLTDAYLVLARCQADTGRYAEALKTLVTIAAECRGKASFSAVLISVLKHQKLTHEAMCVGRTGLLLNDSEPSILNLLGLICMGELKYQEAEQYFSAAIDVDSEMFPARLNQLAVLSRQGKVREGVTAGQLALKDSPHRQTKAYRAAVHQNLLFLSNYDPDKSAEEIFQYYKNFENEICKPLYSEWKRHKNNKNMNRRLRVGYVSPDYRNHAIAKFIKPIFQQHNRERFEVIAYSDVRSEDSVTETFKKMADRWIPVYGLSDGAMAERIRSEEIDILVDLAGHTGGNRLKVFARKPAPVSTTWIGYGYTTGVSAIDYFMGDAHICPPGCEHLFAEKIWRLPDCSALYKSGRDETDETVTELPALRNGFVTLVCLSRSIRINHRVIRVWSKIMQQIPNARLVINSESYADPVVCAELHKEFRSYGIKPDRVFLGYSSPPWNTLKESDIGLDCFPHNAGTTLIDMLSFGVPFVTLADRPSVGRIGSNALQNVGHPELIAQTENQYVDKVLELAGDLDKLKLLRQSVYDGMKRSPFSNDVSFVNNLEAAYLEMFRLWASR